jgi:hypothetical protein
VNQADGSVSLFTSAAGALTLVATYPSGTSGSGSGAIALAIE